MNCTATQLAAATPVTLAHRPHEDVQALFTGTLFVAFGVLMFGNAGLLTGGTTGLALLIHYTLGWNFGAVLFLVNVPFYVLAWRRMGSGFTLKEAKDDIHQDYKQLSKPNALGQVVMVVAISVSVLLTKRFLSMSSAKAIS